MKRPAAASSSSAAAAAKDEEERPPETPKGRKRCRVTGKSPQASPQELPPPPPPLVQVELAERARHKPAINKRPAAFQSIAEMMDDSAWDLFG
jgi:hypothetical protein